MSQYTRKTAFWAVPMLALLTASSAMAISPTCETQLSAEFQQLGLGTPEHPAVQEVQEAFDQSPIGQLHQIDAAYTEQFEAYSKKKNDSSHSSELEQEFRKNDGAGIAAQLDAAQNLNTKLGFGQSDEAVLMGGGPLLNGPLPVVTNIRTFGNAEKPAARAYYDGKRLVGYVLNRPDDAVESVKVGRDCKTTDVTFLFHPNSNDIREVVNADVCAALPELKKLADQIPAAADDQNRVLCKSRGGEFKSTSGFLGIGAKELACWCPDGHSLTDLFAGSARLDVSTSCIPVNQVEKTAQDNLEDQFGGGGGSAATYAPYLRNTRSSLWLACSAHAGNFAPSGSSASSKKPTVIRRAVAGH
jgi:hypothetical protein